MWLEVGKISDILNNLSTKENILSENNLINLNDRRTEYSPRLVGRWWFKRDAIGPLVEKLNNRVEHLVGVKNRVQVDLPQSCCTEDCAIARISLLVVVDNSLLPECLEKSVAFDRKTMHRSVRSWLRCRKEEEEVMAWFERRENRQKKLRKLCT